MRQFDQRPAQPWDRFNQGQRGPRPYGQPIGPSFDGEWQRVFVTDSQNDPDGPGRWVQSFMPVVLHQLLDSWCLLELPGVV